MILCFSAVLYLFEKEALHMRICAVSFVSGPQNLIPMEAHRYHENINSDN